MNNTIGIGIVVAAILVIGGVFWMMQSTKGQNSADTSMTGLPEVPVGGATATSSSSTGATVTPPPGGSEDGTYAMAAVAGHKDASSCWSVIDGNVYDLTAWISRHPGGMQAILGLCGIDGSAKFHGQHGDNAQQANALAKMKIGVLAE